VVRSAADGLVSARSLGRGSGLAQWDHGAAGGPGHPVFAGANPQPRAMFALTPATRIFVALAPVDLRRSFNGLAGWVQQELNQDPSSGNVFVFVNPRRKRVS
jgi:transposase